jgi:serine protease AprX
MILGGCRPAIQTPAMETAVTAIEQTVEMAAPTETAVPPTVASSATARPGIELYSDVRQINMSDYTGPLDRSIIMTFWYNESNKWPEAYTAVAQDILERGKNPGLGVRNLHEQGITGKGVNVAIIDQNLVTALDHPEYRGKIVKYFDVGTHQPDNSGSMHGPAVASLLVGETTGTAPEAGLYFVAEPSWNGDAQYFADALNWIIDENEKLPAGDKIRVVSVSAAPSGPGSPFTKNNAAWDTAVERATAAGILVLDCTDNRGITAPCYYDLDDPDNAGGCIPGWPDMEKSSAPMPGRIFIPTSRRTTAEEYSLGADGYQYTGVGGLSWSVPYLAGVLALGWQIRPELTGEEMLQIVFDTAYIAQNGAKIINPPAFIEGVKSAG